MTQLKNLALFILIVGIVGISLNNVFGYNTITYLQRYKDPYSGLWFYKYDLKGYVENLNNSLEANFNDFVELPTRQWRWDANVNNWWEVLINNIAVVYNYLVVIWNWGVGIVWHLGAWLLSNVLALIGFDMTRDYTNTPSYWFINLIQMLRSGVFQYI